MLNNRLLIIACGVNVIKTYIVNSSQLTLRKRLWQNKQSND